MTNDRKPQPTPTREREPYNAASEADVAEKTRESKAREARRIEGLRKLVADPDMRLWLWDLLAKCGVYKTSFTGNSETFFREGSRNIGLQLQADIMKYTPEAFITMMKESDHAS